jgi:predicted transcriptional regulator
MTNDSENLTEMKSKLLSVQVTDENVALNLMVSFLNLAQRRGIFSIDESAKIWECMSKFMKNTTS